MGPKPKTRVFGRNNGRSDFMTNFTELTIPTTFWWLEKKTREKGEVPWCFQFCGFYWEWFLQLSVDIRNVSAFGLGLFEKYGVLTKWKTHHGIGFFVVSIIWLSWFIGTERSKRANAAIDGRLPWGQRALQATWLCKWWDAPGEGSKKHSSALLEFP